MNDTDAQADEGKGRLKKAAGEVTGDDDLKQEGEADKATGTVKEKASEASDKVGDAADSVKDKLTGD